MSETSEAESRLGRESAAVAAVATVLALIALRARPAWLSGAIGHRDAWQNLWNLDHLNRALFGGGELLRTDRLWAPEGASLLAHTLALPLSIPAALLSRLTGPFLAYDLAVVFTYALAAAGLYRLARRLGAGPAGAALGAFVFAFSPQRSARAAGHLNLLGLGFLPFALEGLLLASRREGSRRLAPALLAGLALALLALTDWYLAVLGALAASSLAAFETARAAPARRAGVAGAAALAAALALSATLPFAVALSRETSQAGTSGHEARWCSSALTSLAIPSRVQLLSRCTRSLTERNRQNPSEAASYLGWVPLLLTAWMAAGRERRRPLDFALVAGGAALVLALGPRPRVFDRLLELPLPYGVLEELLPPLRLGGCVNRYIQLVYLPLALGTALAATRLLARGRRAAVAAATVLLVAEYAPADPGISVLEEDAALRAVARGASGHVLDLDTGPGALARQLVHGRPQTLGYLSRTPPESLALRRDDPVLGPLLDGELPAAQLPPAAAAAMLRHRWGVAAILAPVETPAAERARGLGWPPLETASVLAFAVPAIRLAPVEGIRPATPAESSGVFVWGFGETGALELRGRRLEGRFCDGTTSLLAPLEPGIYALTLASAGSARVETRWGRGRSAARTVSGIAEVPVPIQASDLAADGTFLLRIAATPFGASGRVLVVALERTR